MFLSAVLQSYFLVVEVEMIAVVGSLGPSIGLNRGLGLDEHCCNRQANSKLLRVANYGH